MKKVTKLIAPALVAAGSIIAVGGAAVSADTTTSTNSANTSTQSASTDQPPQGESPAKKDGGVIVSDEAVIASVTSAVQAKYEGQTVDRVAKLPSGSYLAFTQSTATGKVIVTLDGNYAITEEKTLPAGGPKDGERQPPTDDSSESSSANATE